MKQSWDQFYLSLSNFIAQRSKDPSTKCGAVIIRPDNSVCSVGYNGFPRLMQDDPILYDNREEKIARVIHAELNAVFNAREPVHGYTMYISLFPCHTCFLHCVQAGITRFIVPKPSEDIVARWGASFDKVRQYAKEMNTVVHGKYNFIEIVEL